MCVTVHASISYLLMLTLDIYPPPLSYKGTISDTVVRDIPAKLTEANITPKEVVSVGSHERQQLRSLAI